MKQRPLWPVLDDYGLHKIPLRFYALLLLLLRPYICWVMVLTLPQTQRDMLRWFYPMQHDFIVACLLASPLLLLLAALSQRKPKGQPGWRHVWRIGRAILFAIAAVDLVLSITQLPPQVMLDAPWRIVTPVLLLISVFWLWRSRTLTLVFAEWPDATPPAKAG
ncbi:MAG: DUF2919 domain-containing protein [Gammaproteobacteria bacterium]|nr:DUF2919 domain-containing protein [Gammaproteobacteria bacterium]MBU1554360.1 DUF2919 domain-containing protein [Gammaproteobacteria bacterium]MBU2070644.1 DUF2919 domain-containing protein [Gammaproteobacteria bacterium]MBU2182126.1 DUF2919 domain-containing protein [Gammaproteobacteria bacterium]MBU2207013.1 DUF2919 domain-containing protein [Gammaproteobacteria bacterium]